VVAFDADSTLWLTDVANRLWDYLLSGRRLRPEAAPVIAAALASQDGASSGDPYRDMARLQDLYAEGRADERVVVTLQATGLAGFTVDEVRRLAAASFASPERSLASVCFEGMAELIGNLREAGARVVIVSGSPQIAVEEAVRVYGLAPENVCSLRSRIVAGRLQPELDGPLTSGAGKVEAYRRLGLAAPLAAFGDSPSDLPLLRTATGLAGLVNPRPGLLAEAGTIPAPVRCIRISRTVSGLAAELPDQNESTLV
jgi:HAD superfamily phosphoserine phosphatase-like hydrolase